MRKRVWAAMLVIVACGASSARAQSSELSFEELWAYAQEHSPALRSARSERARTKAADAQVRGALAENPTLSVEGGPRFQGNGRSYDLSIGLSQPVRIAGERHTERELAQATGQRVEADVAASEWYVRQELRDAYRRAATALARTQVAGEVLAFEERVLALLRKQVAAGETAPLKLKLAEVEVLQARQASILAAQDLLEDRLDLARLAGMPVSAPPMPRAEVQLAELPPTEELLRTAQAMAPHLKALRARTREEAARLEVANRRRFPQPEIGAAYVREGSTPVAGPVSHSAIATLSLPLSLWSRNQGERAAAQAESAIVRASLDAEQTTLEVEVARLRTRVEAEAARLALYDQSLLPNFADHLALVEKALALGEMDIFDVATFRSRLLQAQLDALEAREGYLLALTQLETLVGVEMPAHPPAAPAAPTNSGD